MRFRLPWVLWAAAGLAAAAAALALSGRKRPEGLRIPVPGYENRWKSTAVARAERRAYEGAPPVIAHPPFGSSCGACHTESGLYVEGVGWAPPMPHGKTPGLSAASNCRQCHVFRMTSGLFRENSFDGGPRISPRGDRATPGAPPTIPHRIFFREDCGACHAGPAAREEIRCSHPERLRCTQCHVPSETSEEFRP